MDNSREAYSSVNSPLEFELDDGPAIEELLAAYPEGVVVDELSHSSEETEDKVSIATALFKEGFLVVEDDVTRSTHPDREDDDDDDGDDDDDQNDIF